MFLFSLGIHNPSTVINPLILVGAEIVPDRNLVNLAYVKRRMPRYDLDG